MNPWKHAFTRTLYILWLEAIILGLWSCRWLVPAIKTAALRLLTGNS